MPLTQDIDFARAGRSLSLALPGTLKLRTTDAIESLGMGFLPITQLAGKAGATFLNPREPEFRLDFLTTRHRGGSTPFFHPQLNVALQPLPFMEFSLEQVEQAVVFARDVAVLVNVPEPARFALHKLIVYGERTAAYRGDQALLTFGAKPKPCTSVAALAAPMARENPALSMRGREIVR